MKLNTKLILYFTLSKLMIIGAFLLALPYIFDWISLKSTNAYLKQQERKVFENIEQNGLKYYLSDDESFGSYTMLKEEYISLEPLPPDLKNTNRTFDGKRIIESDTLDYRILSRTFNYDNKSYLLEIGRTKDTINQYNVFLRRIALYVLIGLVLVTLVLDSFFSRFILKPLKQIIDTNILGRTFPFKETPLPIKTTTTDFNMLNDSLIQLMDQVNSAFDREKEFTANASHELLTPISILKSKIENLMLSEDIDESIGIKLLDMMRILNRLNSIIQSLLLIARIDNEQFEKVDEVHISHIIDEIKEEMEDKFAEKEIELHNMLKYRVPLQGLNKELIFHLFSNLIRNAIKYNKQRGSITISDGFAEGRYWVYIADTGDGLPPEMLYTIFNRFNTANRKAHGGFGLGLSIVNSIANYFSITLKAQSKPDVGSTFSVGFIVDSD